MYFTQRVVGNGSATVIFKERNIIPSTTERARLSTEWEEHGKSNCLQKKTNIWAQSCKYDNQLWR